MKRNKARAGVFLPLAITLAIQALVSMAAVTIPVLAPAAAGDFGVPLAWLGIYTAIFYGGGMASSLICGDLIRRYGPIRFSQVCLVLCGAGLIMTAAGSAPLMIPAAFLIGIGYGTVTPASSHILAKTTPPHLMSLTFSIKQSGVPMGGAMAGALIPVLVLLVGWKGAALVSGGACFVLAVVSGLARRELDADREREHRVRLGRMAEPLKIVLSLPPLRNLAVISLFFAWIQVSLTTYYVSYLVVGLKMPLVKAGLTLTVALSAGVVGRIFWGWIADRFDMSRTFLGILGIAMALSAATTAVVSGSWPYAGLLALSALFGGTAVGWNGIYLAEVARLAPSGKAGTATGGTLFFTYFGSVTSPLLFGAICGKGHRYALAYSLMAIPALLFSSAMLFRKRSGERQAVQVERAISR